MKMITVEIQGKKVQANLLNPDVVKKVESGFTRTLERFSKAKECKEGSEGVREQCQAVIDYVVDIFGEDAAAEIFGDEVDLISCMDVLEEIQEMYPKQVNRLINEKTAKLDEKLKASEKSDA